MFVLCVSKLEARKRKQQQFGLSKAFGWTCSLQGCLGDRFDPEEASVRTAVRQVSALY